MVASLLCNTECIPVASSICITALSYLSHFANGMKFCLFIEIYCIFITQNTTVLLSFPKNMYFWVINCFLSLYHLVVYTTTTPGIVLLFYIYHPSIILIPSFPFLALSKALVSSPTPFLLVVFYAIQSICGICMDAGSLTAFYYFNFVWSFPIKLPRFHQFLPLYQLTLL